MGLHPSPLQHRSSVW